MSLWSWFAGVTSNSNESDPMSVGTDALSPGDPDGFVVEGEDTYSGERAAIMPSPWSGWPAEWAPPNWDHGRFEDLVDAAWGAMDFNASVLSAMPVYRTRNGQVLEPMSWMMNPDPSIYTAWPEFAKQLFWDYQLGEAFVLPMARAADGFPMNFRVIPAWLMNVELKGGRREYNLGSLDVTDDILHIRYKSTTDSARGIGPLESGRNRLIAAGILTRYAMEIARGGGIPQYVLEVEQMLTRAQADELLDQWWTSRMQSMSLGQKWKPAVLSGGAKANPLQLSPQDMALLDLTQFNDARIVNLLGIPPFLMGLPSGESMTYSNVTSLFDFHDRRYLKTAATHVMSALSGWALPRGQAVELNRDEYSRPALKERAEAYEKLHQIEDESGRAITAEEIRTMERLVGMESAEALTGGGRS